MREIRFLSFVCLLAVSMTAAAVPLTVNHFVGAGCGASFNQPAALAADAANNVYVADTFNHAIKKITPDGRTVTISDFVLSVQGIAVDAGGNVYFSDGGMSAIHKLDVDGTRSTVASATSPTGVALGEDGTVYYTNQHAIMKKLPEQAPVVLAGSPGDYAFSNGPGYAARFHWPGALAVDANNNVYVADRGNLAMRKIAPDGTVTTLGNFPHATPNGVTMLPNGNVLFSADRLYEYTPAGAIVTTYGKYPSSVIDDGPVNDVAISGSLAVDSSGRIYVANPNDSRIRRISGGRISTFAGQRADAREDHGPCETRFDPLMGIAVNATGIHVVDHRVTTYQLDGSYAVRTMPSNFANARDAAFDTSGNLYVIAGSDVWKIEPSGFATILANGFTGSANLAVDANGIVYVSSFHRHVIWRITAPGVVDIYAGSYAQYGTEDGGPGTARFSGPRGIAVGPDGSLYVADSISSTIRKIATDRTVTTIAGTTIGGMGSQPTDGDRNSARFGTLGDLEYDPFHGHLFVVDGGGTLVRRVAFDGSVETVGQATAISAISSDRGGRLYIATSSALLVGFVSATSGQTVQFSNAAFTSAEGTTQAAFTVQRSAGDGDMTIYIAIQSGSSATPKEDFISAPFRVTMFAGETTKTFFIPLFDDTRDENDESLIVVMSAPTGGATVGPQHFSTLTIADDDAPPTLTIRDASIVEGHTGSKTMYFTLSRSAGSSKNVSVTATAGGGSATPNADYQQTPGVDYNGPLTKTIYFTPGEISKVVPFDVVGDTTAEGNETFHVTLSSSANSTIADGLAVGTIIDDETSQTLAFQSATYTVAEGQQASINVTRTGSTAGTVTVDYATANSTAVAGSDYTATSGTLTFNPGETTKSFAVTALTDDAIESSETFTVSLSNATGGASIGPTSGATVTITDIDTPKMQFAPKDVLIDVSLGSVVLTVTRTGNTSGSSSVNWSTIGGTARIGSDFQHASGTLQFAAGDTSKTINIALLDDRIPESRERFTVALTSPSGGTLQDAIATITILDDDAFANTYRDQLLGTADGDFNGDGKSDSLWRNEATGQHLIWMMNGAQVVSGSAYIEKATSFRMAGVADFNDDGKSDLVWYDGNAGVTELWVMNGHQRVSGSTYNSMALPWELIGLGDFNADGDADILWRNMTSGAMLIWYLDGTQVVSGSSYFVVDPSFWVQAIDDFNNDGYADLVWQNGAGHLDIWLMQRSVMIGHQDYAGFGGNWLNVGVADFNGDGTPDLLLRNLGDGRNLIWYMNGAQVAQGSAFFLVDPNFRVEILGDFNGDYKTDIGWRRIGGSTVDFWLMNGHTYLGSGAYESFDATWRGLAPR
jgi:sugar lactone lactonase YvrE